MSEHTMGPWVAVHGVSWYVRTPDDEARNGTVLAVGVGTKADALLMAAAPDLLDALRAILANTYGCPFCDSGVLRQRVDGQPPSHDDECGYVLASEAIAKATGATQPIPPYESGGR